MPFISSCNKTVVEPELKLVTATAKVTAMPWATFVLITPSFSITRAQISNGDLNGEPLYMSSGSWISDALPDVEDFVCFFNDQLGRDYEELFVKPKEISLPEILSIDRAVDFTVNWIGAPSTEEESIELAIIDSDENEVSVSFEVIGATEITISSLEMSGLIPGEGEMYIKRTELNPEILAENSILTSLESWYWDFQSVEIE